MIGVFKQQREGGKKVRLRRGALVERSLPSLESADMPESGLGRSSNS